MAYMDLQEVVGTYTAASSLVVLWDSCVCEGGAPCVLGLLLSSFPSLHLSRPASLREFYFYLLISHFVKTIFYV